jgi:recombination associated protein RdgC
MFFRNLTLFRFPEAFGFSGLLDGVAACALKPVGALELSSQGFVPPMGEASDSLTRLIDNALWLTVGTEDKILPAAVVNAALAKRLAEIEQHEGRKLGGRARKRLKDDLIHEMLPRALVKPSRTNCYLDLQRSLLVVDTPSRRRAESVVSEIRRALGSFPALPLNAEVAPRAVLTGWLVEALPHGLALGDAAVLSDPADRGARAKLDGQELACDEVRAHLEAGKQVTRLQVTLDDLLQVDVCEDLALRKLRLLDGTMETLENSDRKDLRAELDARFALQVGALVRLFDVLEPAFRWSKAEG